MGPEAARARAVGDLRARAVEQWELEALSTRAGALRLKTDHTREE